MDFTFSNSHEIQFCVTSVEFLIGQNNVYTK